MNHEDLQKLFAENPGKTQKELARVLNRDTSVMNRMVKGGIRIKEHEEGKILSFFNKHTHVDRVGASVYTIQDVELPSSNGGPHTVLSEWQVPTAFLGDGLQPQSLYFMKAKGDTMSPEINNGDRVLVDTEDTSPSPSGIFLLWDGTGYIIRQCETVINSSPIKIKISTKNPAYDTQHLHLSDVCIKGRVVCHIRSM